jgi:transposase
MNDSPVYSDLTEADWTLIEPLLPKLPGSPTGHDPRLVIDGILFLMRSGSGVRTVPPLSTAESYYWLWQADGTWNKIMAALHGRRPSIGLSPDTLLPEDS